MPSTVRHRVQTHRAQLRAQGLRPIQIWVPDVRSPTFKEEARRQSRAVAAAPDEADTMDFLEDIQDLGDDVGDRP
ncbi:antitoxin MazE family protein (plasmid) [Skermanella rosea]|uniref:antitoxin MazE family protein n=1 Tax=Skermanella rosea TaxID=1817965 RepID=UPI0019318C5D|nr:antitoxin MazE family protein [Skermanella rosea]UEM07565.1 antitoxin MazE family protein [Skermanella rosea]